jgi:hypothetical protein
MRANSRILLVCTRVLLVFYSYVLIFYSYLLVCYLCVTRMYFYVTRVLLVCIRMLLVCTRMLLVCTRMYLRVTRMLLVCYSYVLVWCFSHDPRRGIQIDTRDVNYTMSLAEMLPTISFKSLGTDATKPLNFNKTSIPPPPVQCCVPFLVRFDVFWLEQH